jgi:hypothetical protein
MFLQAQQHQTDKACDKQRMDAPPAPRAYVARAAGQTSMKSALVTAPSIVIPARISQPISNPLSLSA